MAREAALLNLFADSDEESDDGKAFDNDNKS